MKRNLQEAWLERNRGIVEAIRLENKARKLQSEARKLQNEAHLVWFLSQTRWDKAVADNGHSIKKWKYRDDTQAYACEISTGEVFEP